MTLFQGIRRRFGKKRTPALDWSSREVRLKMARETAKSPEVEEALQRLTPSVLSCAPGRGPDPDVSG